MTRWQSIVVTAKGKLTLPDLPWCDLNIIGAIYRAAYTLKLLCLTSHIYPIN